MVLGPQGAKRKPTTTRLNWAIGWLIGVGDGILLCQGRFLYPYGHRVLYVVARRNPIALAS